MKEKILLRTLCCLFVAIMACGTALAQNRLLTPPQYKGPIAPMAPDAPAAAPFYSNLVVNTCTACNYDTNNGYFILGPNNCFAPGATQWISYPFVAGHTGVVRSVQLAITQDRAAGFVQECGCRVTDSVSRNTSYLIVGDNPAESQLKAAT